MNKKMGWGIILFALVVVSVISGISFGQKREGLVNLKANDVLVPALPSQVKIKGYVGERIDSCIENRVMVQSIESIIRPFRLRFENNIDGWDWRCEFFGKWFTSAMLAYSYQPTIQHRSVIEKALTNLLKTQSPNGYIGTYDKRHRLQGWDIWGIKYTLLGLIAYYDQTKNNRVLEAACKLADWLLERVGPGKVNIASTGIPALKGLPSSSILEPMVLLYERTRSEKYLDFARYIVHQWSIPNNLAPTGLRLIQDALEGVPPSKLGGAPKAYEMTSCFEGLLDLYRVTGEKRYLQAGIR
ncbi:MAG: beta-L-arabinofuranosidase domain-containing protein, partial [Candidatus Kryptoniota bacterium]